jgi:hypothetical protein
VVLLFGVDYISWGFCIDAHAGSIGVVIDPVQLYIGYVGTLF